MSGKPVEWSAEKLTWVARVIQNSGVVMSPPPWLPEQPLFHEPWASALGHACFTLPHEPRSMAIAPRARRVAVGSKDGSLLVVSRDDRGMWTPLRGVDRVWEDGPNIEERSAIRALAWLDENTLVVGAGAREWLILYLCEDGVTGIDSVPCEGLPEATPHALLRFEGAARLTPPGHWRVEVDVPTPLALGWTRGGPVHVLERLGAQFRARTMNPCELLKDWTQEPIVSATGSRQHLWVLGGDGTLNAYRPGLLNAAAERYRLAPPMEGERFRALSSCRVGLAVLTPSHAAFLPYALAQAWEPGHQTPSITLQDVDKDNLTDEGPNLFPKWTEAHSGVTCSVSWPLLSLGAERLQSGHRSDAPAGFMESDGNRPLVHVVVGRRDQNGLLARSWRLDRSADKTHPWKLERVARTIQLQGRRPVGNILHVRFASSGPDGPSWLVVASREGQLILSSLTPVKMLHAALVEELERQRKTSTSGNADLKAEQRTPLALIELKQLIDQHLPLDACAPSEVGHDPTDAREEWESRINQLDHHLASVADTDLRYLSARCARRLRDSLSVNADMPEVPQRSRALVQRYRDVVLCLMRRAHASTSMHPSTLARAAVGDIQEVISTPPGLMVVAQSSLNLFEEFLRKWFIKGKVQDIRPLGLRGLIRKSANCKVRLDQLAFETRLLGERVDHTWTGHPATNDTGTTRSLVRVRDICIQACNDGALRAWRTGSDRALLWAKAMHPSHESPLEFEQESVRLHHAADFTRRYHHGPYARALCALPIESDTVDTQTSKFAEFIVIVSFKGWREHNVDLAGTPDRAVEAHGPCLLLIRACAALEVGPDDLRDTIYVKQILVDRPNTEIYALATDSERLRPGDTLRLLAGMGGGSDERLIEYFTVTLEGDDGGMKLRVRHPSPATHTPKGGELTSTQSGTEKTAPRARSLHGPAYNPCSSLCYAPRSQTNWTSDLLFSGLHDGGLRVWTLTPGVRGAESVSDLSPSLLLAHRGAVWRVSFLPEAGEAHRGLLAVGTAEGELAVHRLQMTMDTDGTMSLSSTYLISTTLGDAITALLWFEMTPPPEKSAAAFTAGGAVKHLLALTQSGYASIYDVDLVTPLVAPSAQRERGAYRPRRFPGARVDRFRLPVAARAAVLGDVDPEDKHDSLQGLRSLLRFVVGDSVGGLHSFDLVMPLGSAQRWSYVERMRPNYGQPDTKSAQHNSVSPSLSACVGEALYIRRAWLRLIPLREPHMLQFALWHELKDAGQKLASELNQALERSPMHPPQDLGTHFATYRQVLEARVNELFSRRPLDHRPAKYAWEACAGTARRVLERVFRAELSSIWRADLIREAGELTLFAQDLSLRWLDQGVALRGRVLMHTFKHVFDWPDLLLLCWWPGRGQSGRPRKSAPEGEKLLPETLRQYRHDLVDVIIRPRLYYSDALVVLETLETLNRALWLAVAFRYTTREGQLLGGEIRFESRLPGGDDDASMEALTALVADIGRIRRADLDLGAPLSLAFARYFALTLALFPDRPLICAKIISEASLLEAPSDLCSSIELWLEQVIRQLVPMILSLKAGSAECENAQSSLKQIRAAKRAFSCYSRLGRRAGGAPPDVSRNGPGVATWSAVESRADEFTSEFKSHFRGKKAPPSDQERSFRYELAVVLEAIRLLDPLHHVEGSPQELIGPRHSWWYLSQNAASAPRPRHFRHSQAWLARLHELRETIRGLVRAPRSRVPVDPEGARGAVRTLTDDLNKAAQLCKEQIEVLYDSTQADLFQPERGLFIRLLDSWLQQIRTRSADADELLQLLGSYNRHAFRRGTDELMNVVIELIAQESPTWRAADTRGESASSITPEPRRLLRELEARATRLMESSHLANVLMAVALRERFGLRSSHEDSEERVSINALITLAGQIGGAHGLSLAMQGDAPDEGYLSGTLTIWEALLGELIQNIDSYACQPSCRELHMKCEDGGVLIWGPRPFSETLKAPQPSDGDKLRTIARSALSPRVRLAEDRSGASGMGLPMVAGICDLLGLKASVDLVDSRGQPSDLAPHNDLGTLLFAVRIERKEQVKGR